MGLIEEVAKRIAVLRGVFIVAMISMISGQDKDPLAVRKRVANASLEVPSLGISVLGP